MIRKQTDKVTSTAYNSIKQDIIFGNLKPGIKLKLSHLKEQYQASVSILREILNRLASEGFILFEIQRGFFKDILTTHIHKGRNHSSSFFQKTKK
jgi:DNA-binding GntR family transcriptional regulator